MDLILNDSVAYVINNISQQDLVNSIPCYIHFNNLIESAAGVSPNIATGGRENVRQFCKGNEVSFRMSFPYIISI